MLTSVYTVLITFAGGVAAGTIGSLTGLGGGLVMVPLLTLVLHMSLLQAVGVSLFAVIATSVGAAPRFVGTGLSNVRLALFLQMAASSGAIAGALLAHRIPGRALFVIFGLVMGYSAIISFVPTPTDVIGGQKNSPLSERLRLNSRYLQGDDWVEYKVTGASPAFVVMLCAGALSALLGIGSGAFKVLAMDKLMHLPLRVSTATSNFMIGVTAATSAGYYLAHGDVLPLAAGATVLGVMLGAYAGGHWMKKLSTLLLRRVFAVVLVLMAADMLLKGILA